MLCVVVLGGLVLVERDLYGREWLFLLIPVGLVTTPYLWSYDWIVLMPVGIYILRRMALWAGAEKARAFIVMSVGFVMIASNLGVALMPEPQYGIWYPAVFILLQVPIVCSKAFARGTRQACVAPS